MSSPPVPVAVLTGGGHDDPAGLGAIVTGAVDVYALPLAVDPQTCPDVLQEPRRDAVLAHICLTGFGIRLHTHTHTQLRIGSGTGTLDTIT